MSINTNFDVKQIGERLKEVRKTLRKNLEEIGKITGLSKSGISDIEKGKKKPSSVYMYALSIKFNVNINWILTGKGTMFAPDVELNLDFGQDNETVKELIYCLIHESSFRFDFLKFFLTLKKENPQVVDKVRDEMYR